MVSVKDIYWLAAMDHPIIAGMLAIIALLLTVIMVGAVFGGREQ